MVLLGSARVHFPGIPFRREMFNNVSINVTDLLSVVEYRMFSLYYAILLVECREDS